MWDFFRWIENIVMCGWSGIVKLYRYIVRVNFEDIDCK